MKIGFKVILFMLLLVPVAAVSQTAVGQWRTHFNYQEVFGVQSSGRYVFAAAGKGMLRYDRGSGAIVLLNKTTGLTDVDVATFAFDSVSSTLVIAYSNSNVDLVEDGVAINVGDIRRSTTLTGRKDINSIRFHNGNAYLSCAFGIVVVNLKAAEITETYYLGAVNDLSFFHDTIIAATDSGLLYAPLGANLAVLDKWSRDATSLLAGKRIRRLDGYRSELVCIVVEDDSAAGAVYHGTLSEGFAPLVSGSVVNMRSHGGSLMLVAQNQLLLYDNGLSEPPQAIGDIEWLSMHIHDVDIDNAGSLWFGHVWAGLVEYTLHGTHRLQGHSPTGPVSDNAYRLVSWKDKMLLCPGGMNTTYSNIYLPAGVSVFDNEKWSKVSGSAILDTLHDIVDIAVNPVNPEEWLAASWGHGIVRIMDGEVKDLYNEGNTDGALAAFHASDWRSLRTGAVAFDADGTAWMTNSLVDHAIVSRNMDGQWASYEVRNMIPDMDVDKMVFDSIRGYLWFSGRANRLYVFHTENGMVQSAYVNPNNGSKIETSSINCFVQDHDGDIWLGTNKGIKKIYDGDKAFDNGGNGEMSPCTATNILFSEDGMAEYLMAYENITCMAVDGGNRKWVGTAGGGLYLLSANGLQQLEHFNTTNSPLLSNKIMSVAVNPVNGEVFVGTDQGLQSYRGTAVYATEQNSSGIHAFPNPVKPGYTGTIAIKGFSRNALVHITDAAGHTVFSTTAHGGQAIWNGRTNSGERVATGVYFVFASDVNGGARAVTKILFIK